MRDFSLTELSNRSGEIVEAAVREPVGITRRGKRKFILLAAEDYDRLLSSADPRRVYGPGETPATIAALFLPELDRLAKMNDGDN